jgi:nitrate/TMAO reductase-like tetraheme cytochrome c subunit
MDTREKFEAQRLKLAKKVWSDMKETDSRECRNCHSAESMKLEDQVRPARRKHKEAIDKGLTCIECHQGIAHKLPKGWEEEKG